MPLFNGTFQMFGPNPGELQRVGPVLPVEVMIPRALEEVLRRNGEPVPAPVRGLALIDTGASNSGVEEAVFQVLRLSPVGKVPIHTPSGPAARYVYPVRIVLGRPPNLLVIEFGKVVGVQLASSLPPISAPMGLPLIVLLGRDLLANCLFIYNGPQSSFSLCL